MYLCVFILFFQEILDGQRSGDQLKRGRRKGRNKQEVPAFAEPDTTVEVKTPFDLAKVSAYKVKLFVTILKKLIHLICFREPSVQIGLQWWFFNEGINFRTESLVQTPVPLKKKEKRAKN
jgi:hypothetical protein